MKHKTPWRVLFGADGTWVVGRRVETKFGPSVEFLCHPTQGHKQTFWSRESAHDCCQVANREAA